MLCMHNYILYIYIYIYIYTYTYLSIYIYIYIYIAVEWGVPRAVPTEDLSMSLLYEESTRPARD